MSHPTSSSPSAPLAATPLAAAQPVAAPPAPAGFHFLSYLLGLVTALILSGGALYLLRAPEPPAMQLQPPPAVPSPIPTATCTPPAPVPVVVFVSGAVLQPGLYTLPAGARIGDAIAAAGGLLPVVDGALVNQAQLLADGAQLHIPLPAALQPPPLPSANLPPLDSTGAAAEPSAGEPGAALAAVPLATPQPGLNLALPTATPAARTGAAAGEPAAAQLASGAAGTLPAAGPPPAAGSPGGGLIDVNTATTAELEALPGIGPAKAQAIVDNRPYAAVDELDRVPGIGPATLERLRPLVTAG